MPSRDNRGLNWKYRLELKVIADVGLVGFPNVGKSTLLSRVTNAQPKDRQLSFHNFKSRIWALWTWQKVKGFVIADIPGLIEGASEGIGLGHAFLKHIERTQCHDPYGGCGFHRRS